MKFSKLAEFLAPLMIGAIKAAQHSTDPGETKAQKVVKIAEDLIPIAESLAGRDLVNDAAAVDAIKQGAALTEDSRVVVRQANDLFVQAMKLLSTIKTIPASADPQSAH